MSLYLLVWGLVTCKPWGLVVGLVVDPYASALIRCKATEELLGHSDGLRLSPGVVSHHSGKYLGCWGFGGQS
jgi:hypothetical protein